MDTVFDIGLPDIRLIPTHGRQNISVVPKEFPRYTVKKKTRKFPNWGF